MAFTKLESAGNDFVLIDEGAGIENYNRFAIRACNRHFGIGADGLLVLTREDTADAGMRIFNPDGSEAEACGNGLRCLVAYAADNGIIQNNPATIKTIAGTRRAFILANNSNGTKIETSMGEPEFRASRIPVVPDKGQEGRKLDINMLTGFPLKAGGRQLSLSFVSMGNPHAIHFTNRPVAGFPLSRVGPMVETAVIFPARTNFEVVRVLSRTEVEARVWERAAGETLACGSGACAAGVAAQILNLVDNPVKVSLPGGMLEVRWDKPGEVYLRGVARTVFRGEFFNDN
ncbi:MAG: diaminopimelate epimerase [Dehalococcoidaceae bacterium]|nr:diaminopimelate epimerase [Dehalococcoidaceae bacterium]